MLSKFSNLVFVSVSISEIEQKVRWCRTSKEHFTKCQNAFPQSTEAAESSSSFRLTVLGSFSDCFNLSAHVQLFCLTSSLSGSVVHAAWEGL